MALIDIWEKVKTYKLNSPESLALFMRQNLAKSNPQDLFLTPFLLPVYIANPSGSSPIINWYDRNPKFIHGGFDTTYGSHALTERMFYVVPNKRKAFIECGEVLVLRQVVDGVGAGLAIGSIAIDQISGGGGFIGAAFLSNVLGTQDHQVIGQNALLLEGQRLSFLTFSGDAGAGQVEFVCHWKVTEFDA